MPELPRIVAVVGTNASGKSSLGVRLAQRFGGEIVSADSRQVFRGLDLGSGKISPEEMRGVPHHLLDVCEPNDFFSMADFQALAYRAIDGILARVIGHGEPAADQAAPIVLGQKAGGLINPRKNAVVGADDKDNPRRAETNAVG